MKQHNFNRTMNVEMTLAAQQMVKDVYQLDFLYAPNYQVFNQNKLFSERIERLNSEFGAMYNFVGNNFQIYINNNRYHIDLLLYNRTLQSYVAIQIYTQRFAVEFAGKMNFNLNLLNYKMKKKSDNTSIGIIICTEKDDFEVEYALKELRNPIAVSTCHLKDTQKNSSFKSIVDKVLNFII